MMVAARSSSECAASERIASEPVASPTTPLASVRPPEAAIDVSATRCLMSCMARLRGSGRGRGRQLDACAACAEAKDRLRTSRTLVDTCGLVTSVEVARVDIAQPRGDHGLDAVLGEQIMMQAFDSTHPISFGVGF